MKIYQKRIYRADLKANPNAIYLFGDNLMEVGLGGQAGEMRGEPNAVGIPTKKSPGMSERDFFTDDEFERNCKALDIAFDHLQQQWLEKVAEYGTEIPIIVPLDGLGTGLAELDTRAPKTFAYLQSKLESL